MSEVCASIICVELRCYPLALRKYGPSCSKCFTDIDHLLRFGRTENRSDHSRTTDLAEDVA